MSGIRAAGARRPKILTHVIYDPPVVAGQCARVPRLCDPTNRPLTATTTALASSAPPPLRTRIRTQLTAMLASPLAPSTRR